MLCTLFAGIDHIREITLTTLVDEQDWPAGLARRIGQQVRSHVILSTGSYTQIKKYVTTVC